jgi:hypothetical protein
MFSYQDPMFHPPMEWETMTIDEGSLEIVPAPAAHSSKYIYENTGGQKT